MKRMLKILSWLCVLLLVLPMHAVGEELVQFYLERSEQNDYTAYLASVGAPAAVTESMKLYEVKEGAPLAEGERLTFTVNVPQDVFGYPVLTYAMASNNILDNGFTLMVGGALPYAECSTLTLDTAGTGSLHIEVRGNRVEIFLPGETKPLLTMDDGKPFTHGMWGFFSKGRGVTVLECTILPLE